MLAVSRVDIGKCYQHNCILSQMFNEWEIPLNIWTHYLPSTSHPIIRRSHHLSRQSEGKGEHFALDVVAEVIAVFDGPHTTLLGHADVEDLHDHKQVAAKAR